MSRRWLVAVSVIAHLSILAGVFVSGIWRVERLEAKPARREIHLPLPPPPAPAGGLKAPKPLEFTPKTPPVAKGPRQPTPQVDPPPVEPPPDGDGSGSGSGSGSGDPTGVGTCTQNCPGDAPAEPVCGNGSVEAGEQCDDGNTNGGDGCSATCRIEVAPPRPPATVAPGVLSGLRISGETQVHPDEITQNQMIREGAGRVVGVVDLCIAADGSVASTRLRVSTKYAAYDAALVAAVAGWRYQPYRRDGIAVPACSTVRFVYTIQ